MQNAFQSDTMKSIIDSKRFVFAVSGMLGAIFFMCIFGVRVLNPTYIDWLIVDTIQDRFQHYLGWVAYRNSAWYFPPGLHSGTTYPFTYSIVFSDSIPILAIPFKAISFILPQNFQYFGWFGFLCYIMQGGFGGLIIKRISGKTGFSIICSLFFVMSSFMAYRLFNHTALTAHFLLLAAIYVCITKNDRERSTLRNCVIWGILVVAGAGTHIYLLVMVFGIMCFYYLDNLFEHKKIWKSIIEIGVPSLIVLLVFFMNGVFHSDPTLVDRGLGETSANLNQIINPNAVYSDIGVEYSDFSRFIRPFPLLPHRDGPGALTSSFQAEGATYIGLGMIILFFVSMFVFIVDCKDYKSKLSDKKTLRQTIIAATLFLAYYVFALSPVITFNENVILDYRGLLPGRIMTLWAIFRGTGRFMWVCVYILMIVFIWIVAKKFKKSTLIIMAVILVLVQFADISGYFFNKGRFFREEHVYEKSLKSEIWDVIARDYTHLFYVDGVTNMIPILVFASHNGLTLNDTYLARQNVETVETHKALIREMLYNGVVEDNKVYIFDRIPELLINETILFVYIVDGVIIGVTREIENAERINKSD